MKPLSIEDILPHNKKIFAQESVQQSEWVIISKLLNYSINWLVTVLGSSSELFLLKSFNYEDFDLRNVQGEEVFGVFAYFDSQKLNEMLATLENSVEYVMVYNKCLELVHQEVDLMKGEIYSRMPGKYVFCWTFNDHEMFRELHSEAEFKEKKSIYVMAKTELAITAITSALFKLRVYLRNYTYRVHDKLYFNIQGLVSFSIHSGWAVKGPVGGFQKVDIGVTGKVIQELKYLCTLCPSYEVDVVITTAVQELLSRQTKLMLYPIDKVLIPEEDAPTQTKGMKIYTVQLHERLIQGFEITSLDSNFVIFKKSRDEKMIYRRMLKRDCYLAILKPSLGKYIVQDPEVHAEYLKAYQAARRKQGEIAESYLIDIISKVRTTFKPADILQQYLNNYKKNSPNRKPA